MVRARKLATWIFLAASLSASVGAAPSFEDQELESTVLDLESKVQEYEVRLQEMKRKYLTKRNSRVTNLPSIMHARLTSTTGVPVTVAPVTSAGTVYLTPYKGNYLTLYYRGEWRLFRFSEVSLALTGTTASNSYDIFAYRGSTGVVTLERSTAWTTRFARSEAITKLDGVWVKSSDNTRRYLGTIRTNGTNTYNDNFTERGLWNYYNRQRRFLRVFEGGNTWNYNTNAFRIANANAANVVSYVIGINEALVNVRVKTNTVSANNTNRTFTVGIGLNTVTLNVAQLFGTNGNPANQTTLQTWAEYAGYPPIGYHQNSWIEKAVGGANVTSWGDNGAPSPSMSGIVAIVEG